MSILEQIHTHADLAALSAQEQTLLCAEIRQFLVTHVAKTGGHLASNLGVVELTVAIETVFDTEHDRLVFDVGHQSYVHKLLTGRAADFDSLRQFGGIAGFPKPSESVSDAFVAGHASSSVSIALGMARARSLRGEDYSVLALLGDGSATGGMAYEGLNDAAVSKEPLIIILNDNAMSIDHSVGGMAKHLSRLRTKEHYIGMKARYKSLMQKIPCGQSIYRVTRRWKDSLRRLVLPKTIFEKMGLEYLGPVDGHDLPELIRILKTARNMRVPVLIHVLTKKGHGYQYAEEHPCKFHGVGKFDPVTGELLYKAGPTFSDAFGEEMTELAGEDPAVCAITAAMPGGTGLLGYRDRYPHRLFDVGIAEEHAVSMAGGLAKQGAKPVVAIYSTFLQRSFDQIMQDVAILRLHVVFAVDRAGLVGDDGETHHGIYDVGFLRLVPGMRILCPVCHRELKDMLRWAVEDADGPVAVRYPRGGEPEGFASGWQESQRLIRHRRGGDATLISYGTMTRNLLEAADLLTQQGMEVTVLRLLTVAPLPVEEILEQMAPDAPVIVAEEASSGIGRDLAFALPQCRVYCRDIGERFVTHGSADHLYRLLGLDGQSIADFTAEVCRNEG